MDTMYNIRIYAPTETHGSLGQLYRLVQPSSIPDPLVHRTWKTRFGARRFAKRHYPDCDYIVDKLDVEVSTNGTNRKGVGAGRSRV